MTTQGLSDSNAIPAPDVLQNCLPESIASLTKRLWLQVELQHDESSHDEATISRPMPKGTSHVGSAAKNGP